MSEKEGSTKERILLATITCIERDGVEATGIREIAREAQVNSAAINYHFQSKEKLISLALERTLERAFGEVMSGFDELVEKGLGVRDALQALLEELLANATRYPRIAYAHLRDALVNHRYDGAAVRRLNTFLAELAPKVAPAAPHLTGDELRVALSQIWAALFLLAMMPKLFDPFVSLDFGDEERRRAWVRQMLKLLFPE